MAKIAKNLSDKDMVQGYTETVTMESMFLAADEAENKKKHPAVVRQTAQDIHLAYLTPDVIDKLGKMLLELKVDLYQEGIRDYHIHLRREGKNIVLSPVEAKK